MQAPTPVQSESPNSSGGSATGGTFSAVYDSQTIGQMPGPAAWTVRAMVQEWLAAPASNFGLLLNSDSSRLADRYRFFAS